MESISREPALHPQEVENKPQPLRMSWYDEGAAYTIRRGDTVYGIAKAYGVSPKSIIKTNHISDVRSLQPGQEIIIPGTAKKRPTITYAPSAGTGKSNSSFVWPVNGKMVTYYGDKKIGQRNTGIDIKTEPGQDVVAVRGGVVLTATEGLGGKVVVIEHRPGLDSWYGQVGKILVNKGNRVRQGQVIARTDDNQPILHFKLFVDDRPVNPLKHLH